MAKVFKKFEARLLRLAEKRGFVMGPFKNNKGHRVAQCVATLRYIIIPEGSRFAFGSVLTGATETDAVDKRILDAPPAQ